MKAGMELDRLIHEDVMGFTLKDHPYGGMSWHNGEFFVSRSHPSYSTDIASAWEVVEKLVEMDFYPDLISTSSDGWVWQCVLHTTLDDEYPDNPFYGRSNTAPHAICLAALKAIE